jgi:branched-chain amino acid transport system permease protein
LNPSLLPQYIVIGIQLGAIYSLIALGYTMVYGVLRFINFAYGDVYMVGAYIAYYASMVWFSNAHLNPYLLLLVMLVSSMTICGSLGFVIERLAYRPLRNAPRIAVLITAIGISLFLEYSGKFFFQTQPPPSIGQSVNILSHPLKVFGLDVDGSQIAVLAVTLVLMFALWQFVTRTRTGRAMRAVSHDFNTASLMGVNVDVVVAITFVIGSALAGAGGMMNATSFGTPLTPFYGLLPGVKAFVAAVLGGIGNIPGAVVGGLVMGLAEMLIYWAGFGGYRDAVAFVLLIGILLIKPSGLFGRSVEKV